MRIIAQDADHEEPGKRKARSESQPVEVKLIEEQVEGLRERISDAAHEIDVYKTKTAAAMGAGVFLFLLAIGAAYDIASGKAGLWFLFGVTRETLNWLAGGLALASICLFAMAAIRHRKRDIEGEARLAELEEELARLLDRRDEISRLSES